MFLVLEYCPCGDLGKYLEQGSFSEEVAKIYACELILAIEYLHKNGVIYRDLKPDNILVAENGHIKLTDYGLSKMNCSDEFNSSSFCGTFAYLAPEMISNLGYGKTLDWYCFGAVLYEFCVRRPPYYRKQKEELIQNILHGALELPKAMNPELKDLLVGLLDKVPTQRLGFHGAQEIKNHAFFADIDWTAFNRKNAKGGYDGVFVPRRELQTFSKSKKKLAAQAMSSIADDPGLKPSLRLFKNIEGWNFVRDSI